jgi:hypothetical protein
MGNWRRAKARVARTHEAMGKHLEMPFAVAIENQRFSEGTVPQL